MYWILGVVLILVLVYGGNQGWFKSEFSVVTDENTINLLDNPSPTIPQGVTCSLSLDKSSIDVGGSITGTIKDGVNTLCEVFSEKGGVWKKESEGTTDLSGTLTQTRTINEAGTYTIKALCAKGTDKECVTNGVTLTVKPRDCNQECVDRNYAGGTVATDCRLCVGDKECINIFETTCCCTLKESYPEEQHTIASCTLYASTDGYDNRALGIYNSMDCITHANSQCVEGSAGQTFYSPNCCGWNCQQAYQGAYSEAECISYSQSQAFYGGSAVTVDGSVWGTQDCTNTAQSSCASQGLEFGGDDDQVDDNCCMWNCEGVGIEDCSAEAIARGYNHFNQDPRSWAECNTRCGSWCGIMGQSCLVSDFISPDCCMWSCFSQADVNQCADYCHGWEGGVHIPGVDSAVCFGAARQQCGGGLSSGEYADNGCCCWDCA